MGKSQTTKGNNNNTNTSSDTVQKLTNENETLKSEIAKTADPNAKPRTITKGNRVYPMYQKNTDKIVAILPKIKK